MSNLYVTCELGPEKGRVMLGSLQKEGLTISETADFQELTTVQEGVTQWDMGKVYQHVLSAVRSIVAQEVPVRGISFQTSVGDPFLFDDKGALMGPATRPNEAAVTAELNRILSKVPLEVFYQETGTHPSATSTLCQLSAEPGRRLKKAAHTLSLADAFNYLFSGVPQTEISQAAQTQFYNPTTKAWSGPLLAAGGVSEKLLPPLTPAGTLQGKVRTDVAEQSGLEDAQVITTCSNQRAAALAALHIADPEPWAFLWPDQETLMGTRLDAPFIDDISREMKYCNLPGYDECIGFFKKWIGLTLMDQCQASWSAQDRALDNEVLLHLATSAAPFEAFIDPGDSRFSTPPDMPQAIQAFCRETGQEAPRKPGPILRCVLESLALHYRKAFLELQYLTGVNFSRLYILGGHSNPLLNHFLANALQIPVLVVRADAMAIGNVAIQALALKHLSSIEEAREVVSTCLKARAINPHATAWTEAYDRFLSINPV